MKTYNKLVRDKIPQIIQANGQTCTTRILDNKEYIQELNKKLLEETNEFLKDQTVEELADMQEVILSILKTKNTTFEQLEEIRKQKAQQRGGFKDKIFLETTSD